MEPGENMYSIEYSFKAILATILAAYFGIQGTTVFLKITDDFFTPSMDKNLNRQETTMIILSRAVQMPLLDCLHKSCHEKQATAHIILP